MTTTPIVQHISTDDREACLQLINRVMPVFATGMHKATDAELQHEAERLECVPKSKVVTAMRLIVDAERTTRMEDDRG